MTRAAAPGRGHRRVTARAVARVLLLVSLAVILTLGFAVAQAAPVSAADETAPDQWMTLYDGNGRVICETGFRLGLGDEYLDENNDLWRVESLVGDRAAVAGFVRRVDLSSAVADFQRTLAGTDVAAGRGASVGIYHTHSDESYVPSDGTESDDSGHGGVYRVGDALTAGLQKAGITVNHSYANHLPHDGGAYERSRPTAMSLLGSSTAIFDVHRDAGPAEAYLRRVAGQDVTQIMMVLGRENPQVQANMGFATALKAAADKIYPGLIRGILTTGGRFNQDLSSRALLIEIGTQNNRREEAEAAVANLAGVVPSVLGAGGAGGLTSSGAWRAIGIILALVVVVGGLWLYIATGGNWSRAWQKLRGLGQEFASFLGRRGSRRTRR